VEWLGAIGLVIVLVWALWTMLDLFLRLNLKFANWLRKDEEVR
jgi:hypothetical protein